jgi:hypothetical protein
MTRQSGYGTKINNFKFIKHLDVKLQLHKK